MQRLSLLFAGLVFLGCGSSDKIELTDSGSTATDSGESDTDADTDTDTDTGTDEEILGSWTRRLTMDDENIRFRWTFDEDGSCEVRINQQGGNGQGGPDKLICEFTAQNGDFTVTEEECSDEGVYTYTFKEDKLYFTLVDDPCEGRNEVVPGEWTQAQ